MENSIFHRLNSFFWGVIVVLMVLLAIYVSVGRMLISNVGNFQSAILAELNYHLPFDIEADTVRGKWQDFSPELIMTGVKVSGAGFRESPLELDEGRLRLDVLNTLLSRSLRASGLEVYGLELMAQLDAEGKFSLIGFGGGDQPSGDWLPKFLLDIKQLILSNISLEVALPGGEVRSLDTSLSLYRDGSDRYLTAELVSTRGADIKILGKGLGNPFRPERFVGQLYADIEFADLDAVSDMLADGPPPVWASGDINLEYWMNWNRGVLGMETRMEGRALEIKPREGDWTLPLDRVSLASKFVERENRWTVYASDVQIENRGVMVEMPRLQLDSWGESLRMRATELDLAPLHQLVMGLDVVPPKLAEVFGTLAPRGTLERFQLNVGDIGDPARDWELQANFLDLGLDSWRGAPGVEAATGYVELANAGGFVLLDSRQFSMIFPTVYRDPLVYEEFHGTININWDPSALTLESGLMNAQGEEGVARALFGLRIPLESSPVGLEMDLMVGLAGSHPKYRSKYIPFTLNQGLQQWLSDSVGDGVLEQGAFLWRGSLRRQASDLRTVQLFFNIDDTDLTYHSEWPALEDVQGTVLIDDTSVSVWSEGASLYGSRLQPISAETWMSARGHMKLGIEGKMRGPAADGLAVINNSMLRNYVGDAFARWQLQGDLSADLKLELDLAANGAAPVVDVVTRWQQVDILIDPGNLPIDRVNGQLAYSSRGGFSAQELRGELWGEPLTAEITQKPHAEGQFAPLEVAVTTEVDLDDVREWLDLDLLRFAQGRTDLDVRVDVVPGSGSRLSGRSQLVGATLDLPQPWRTDPERGRPLQFSMPLGGEPTRLDFQLGEDVSLALELVEGKLDGGAVILSDSLPPLESGIFRISGHTQWLDVNDWHRFIATYFDFDFLNFSPDSVDLDEVHTDVGTEAESSVEEAATESAVTLAESEKLTLPTIHIDGLRASRMLLFGQVMTDVELSVAREPSGWQLAAAADWLRGSLLVPSGDSALQLDLAELDLAALGKFDLALDADTSPVVIPDVDVNISGLRHGDRQLGDLAFALRSEGQTIHAGNIRGELAGIAIDDTQAAELLWLQGEDGSTSLDLTLSFGDIGESLVTLGYERILETKGGSLDIEVNWPGGPQDFALASGEGSLMLNVGQGAFLEAPAGASQALKVVSIINLANIVESLSLSHMFEEGIPFDTVEGEVFLHGGTLEVPRLDVNGAASRFQFSALSDVEAQSLEGELFVTLPVASNLPWVAALAGGPAVAAGVFVVSKVFEKQFDLLSTAIYSITGSWNDPQVEFDRIWDEAEDTVSPDEAPREAAGADQP